MDGQSARAYSIVVFYYSDAKVYVFMPLPTIAIIGQTGMKCRKNRKDVKLRYNDDIYLEYVVKYIVR